MKKNFRFLALTAMAGMAATAAMATPPTGVYPAYAENFNALTKVEEAGVFTSKSGAGLWSLVSPKEGDKAFQFYNTTNARNFYMFWGTEGWEYANSKDAGTNNFYMSMDLTITVGNDVTGVDKNTKEFNQRNTEFCVFTEPDASHSSFTKNKGNGNFIRKATNADGSYNYDWQGSNDNWLFDLTEIVNKDEAGNCISKTNPIFAVNGDTSHVFQHTDGASYLLELTIDTVARKVTYLLTNKTDKTTALEGVRDIPAGVHQLPTGIYCNAGRYNSNLTFDNIMVGKAVDKQVPQTPSIAYSTQGDAVSGTTRGFQIYCLKGETIHYEFRNGAKGENLDGKEVSSGTIDYKNIELNENIVYVTNSGTLVAWTEIGADKSKETSFEVVCEEVVLPTPVCKIVGVDDGYAKSYQVTIDNSSIVTNPNITFEYTFTDADGKEVTESNNASGSIIKLDKKGTLKLTSMLFGFTSSATVTVENNIEYECTKVIDFEHMTSKDFETLGFTAIVPIKSTTQSGENNWSARYRIYDDIIEGADTTTYYLPEGITDKTAGVSVNRYVLPDSTHTIDSIKAVTLFAPLVLPSANLSSPTTGKAMSFQIKEGIGLLNNETAQNNVPYGFRGMNEGDFALVYKIIDYGSNSIHEYYGSLEEAKAAHHGALTDIVPANGTFNLYRIQDAISMIKIMSAKNGNPISDLRVDLEDPNAPIYNLQGILMDCSKESLPKGIYLQNGKKFLVK